MSEQKVIYAIGHRNPDTDSICSAIAYANLKRNMGCENVVPARAGSVNKEIIPIRTIVMEMTIDKTGRSIKYLRFILFYFIVFRFL